MSSPKTGSLAARILKARAKPRNLLLLGRAKRRGTRLLLCTTCPLRLIRKKRARRRSCLGCWRRNCRPQPAPPLLAPRQTSGVRWLPPTAC